jgi:serine/threonine-protein kinase
MKAKTIHHYELVRRLGAGGNGVVYLATDTRLMRPVVLKMLRRAARSTDDARERVLREARLAAAIDHPNVCAIYEVGEWQGAPFIAMQFVPGRTLAKLIADAPPTLQLALSIGLQVSDGLAAAHALGIVHRDLKPANVMLTDGGLVKILDFGVAKRLADHAAGAARYGTIAYMAPEQFDSGQSTERSDVFALGLILYELIAGAHAFHRPGDPLEQLAKSIQFADPIALTSRRSETPAELEALIARALARDPADRIATAGELREGLRAAMRAVTGEIEIARPVPAETDRKTGLLAMFTERFLRGGDRDAPDRSVAVLPFTQVAEDATAYYGLALADAIAASLARFPSLVVRPPSARLANPDLPSDPIEAGRRLHVTHVLGGSFVRTADGFDLSWQLLDVRSGALRSGGTIAVPSFDLATVQSAVCNDVFAALRSEGELAPRDQPPSHATDSGVFEDYLQARALLSRFVLHSGHRDDLDAAHQWFQMVLARDPDFAPAHSGLGVTHLQYVSKGFGGARHLVEAQRAFGRALQHDPALLEADLYRTELLLARGQKDAARKAIRRLLDTAPNDFEVRITAGVLFRRDGLLDRALKEFAAALRIHPAGATEVYIHRARIYQYQGQFELARAEIDKGLTLEPRHALLLASLGNLYLRLEDLPRATATLEAVLADNPSLHMAHPKLAMCYRLAGARERASALLTDAVFASAEADCEMAYRVGTYFATDGDVPEAVHWLRRAVYLGNENYSWFAMNPAWNAARDAPDYQRVLADLKRRHRATASEWQRLRPE